MIKYISWINMRSKIRIYERNLDDIIKMGTFDEQVLVINYGNFYKQDSAWFPHRTCTILVKTKTLFNYKQSLKLFCQLSTKTAQKFLSSQKVFYFKNMKTLQLQAWSKIKMVIRHKNNTKFSLKSYILLF